MSSIGFCTQQTQHQKPQARVLIPLGNGHKGTMIAPWKLLMPPSTPSTRIE